MNFTTKVVSCDDYASIESQIESLECDWISALLSRFNVDPAILERAKSDHSYPKYEWRDYLLANFGIQIEKNLGNKKTVVTRTNFRKGDTIVVGEWSRPDIVRVGDGRGIRYEIHLKYFNLI